MKHYLSRGTAASRWRREGVGFSVFAGGVAGVSRGMGEVLVVGCGPGVRDGFGQLTSGFGVRGRPWVG